MFFGMDFNNDCFTILGSLQITESHLEDEGRYECLAENEAGAVYSYSAALYVKGKISCSYT